MAAAALLASLSLIVYAYLGYPLLCFLRARLRPRPIARRAWLPSVTAIVAAHREEGTIAAKVMTLAAQTYRRLDVIIACDGSDDGTASVARAMGERFLPGRFRLLELPRGGKARAINAAAAAARGEILVLTDARQRLSRNAIAALVEDLGDPTVGAVGGALELEGGRPAGIYWRYESWIRANEGRAGSTVGVSGALWAVRRALLAPLPDGTLLDDLLAPLRVRAAGHRVAYEPSARAYDDAAANGHELSRKIRTLSGNFQLFALAPGLLAPWRPGGIALLSHKLLRLAVPWALACALFSSVAIGSPWRAPLVIAQSACYALGVAALVGPARRFRLAALAETFLVLNAAAAAAALRFVRRGRRLSW